MSTGERPVGYEYKHLQVAHNQDLVNQTIKVMSIFWWELQSTSTIVSKATEVFGSVGGNINNGSGNISGNISSRIITERFVTMDFKRVNNVPNLSKIKSLEQEYDQTCAELNQLGCSPLNNYANPPKIKPTGCVTYFFGAGVGGIIGAVAGALLGFTCGAILRNSGYSSMVILIYGVIFGVILGTIGGEIAIVRRASKHKKLLEQKTLTRWQNLRIRLDQLIENNRDILNASDI
jgi:hypothetical protein